MKLSVRFVLCFLAITVFFTSIGLSIFTHFCEEDGAFVSYVLPANDHCGEEEAVEVLPPCCQKEIETCHTSVPVIDQEDCCSDEFSWIKLSVDQDQWPVVKCKSVWIGQLSQAFSVQQTTQPTYLCPQVVNNAVDPPPSPLGRDILIKHQVFRI